ncbi:hypothetical protein [Persicobacter psychrovividus]|uniref:Uncharacterized protein n=1 Tax=Persicobacter psychrovividus TaxID=387638 RepID=A0ABN6LBZ6_9BACT|nr:hypothetical protein PEPS_29960 [Persicobacter psychrovividus]
MKTTSKQTVFEQGSLSQLVWSVIFDGVGMLSYLYPGLGEFADILWAPAAGYIHYKMYGDKQLAQLSFWEELLPMTDVLPTFTLTWFYVRFFKPRNQ